MPQPTRCQNVAAATVSAKHAPMPDIARRPISRASRVTGRNTVKHLMLLTLLTACTCAALQAQSEDGTIWYDVNAKSLEGETRRYLVMPDAYRTVGWDLVALADHLEEAPPENSGQRPLTMVLPLADGGAARFLIEASPVAAPELAMRYPEIRSFRGWCPDDPATTMRCDLSPNGFSAIILSDQDATFIRPMHRYDDRFTYVYRRGDMTIDKSGFQCEVRGQWRREALQDTLGGSVFPLQNELRSYRLAIAATGEYTTFHGGTVVSALAALTTTVNNINAVYERDLAVRLIMVADNDQLIYTNAATDPYEFDLGDENQTNVDNVIGSANYDIGHVVFDAGGGAAYLGVVCENGFKANGFTGTDPPTGPVFDIDYVAHEIGHQFGGEHTFNAETGSCSGGNRSGSTAYEPGGATTIMGYAGICGANNLQNNSDPFFHVGSIEQILSYTRNGGGVGCANIQMLSNAAPDANAGADYTIPAQTPFTLTGSASGGANVAGRTYSWEQFDTGQASNFNVDTGDNAIFRFYPPVTDPSRTFPRLDAILNQTTVRGEFLPTTSRTLRMRFTVRNNNQGGGALDSDEAVLTVVGSAGPFVITSPSGGETWPGNSTQTVSWNVAGTNQAPINCNQVDIMVSTDGGQSFSTVAAAVANDGSAEITVPNTDSSQVRVKAACTGNVFFDISNANLTITANGASCSDYYGNWYQAVPNGLIDVNSNNVVDVLDLINCAFAPARLR